MAPNKQAEVLKDQGNQFFKTGKYAEAIVKYQEATKVDGTQPAYWSNMAACYEKLGKFEDMADAALNCIKADRNFVKGYFRLATAHKQLNDLPNCIKALESGLAVEANNADLKKMKKEVLELQRQAQVVQYCDKVDEYMQNGDIPNAVKTLDLAARLDAGNPRIEQLRKKVQPKFDQMEAKRKAGLSTTELYKERGDEAYKNAQFEKAIEHYTKCIDTLIAQGQGQSELAAKAYSNRAACYKQISHFDGTIADCTAVLEIKPDDVKALIRRAQAFEGVERYRYALQDVKTVLTMDPKVVGKQNWDLCNGMQHRLNRTVTQLKKMNTM